MKLEVLPYQASWEALFSEIKSQLIDVLSGIDIQIEHIGSTSIQGMHAKPIIDIALAVNSTQKQDLIAQILEKSGWTYIQAFEDQMPDRRFFIKFRDPNLFSHRYTNEKDIPYEEMQKLKVAHLHVWIGGSTEWRRHISVRDYLKQFPEKCKAYSELKIQLSHQEWKNGNHYNEMKNDFLQELQRDALDWSSQMNKEN